MAAAAVLRGAWCCSRGRLGSLPFRFPGTSPSGTTVMTHYAVSRWRVLALPPAAEDVALLINLPRVSPFSQNGHSSGQVQLRDFPRVPWGEGTVCKFEAAGRREAGSTRPGDQQQAGHPLANHILSTGAGGPGVCGEGLLTAEGAPGVSHCPLATRAQRRHGWEAGAEDPAFLRAPPLGETC